MQPESRFVEANGLRLHCLVWRSSSETSRPPLVMQHATGFLARLWQPVAERLAGRFDVYAFDSRGHGDSDKPDPSDGDPYHWQNFVDDLKAFLDEMDIRGAPFIGHSAGAAAGAYLASGYPEYFPKLVLIEPIVMPGGFQPDESRRNEMAEGARRRRQVWSSADEIVEAYRTRPTFERWPEEMLRLYAEHGTFRREDGRLQLKCPGEVEGAVFANSASLNTWDVLPKIACPTLVMKGENTEGFLAMVADGVAERVSGARAVTVPDTGHLAPMERPEAVAAEIAAFLGDE